MENKNINLNKEQINFIVLLCEYEIKSNDCLIKDLKKDIKNIKEIIVWKDENDFIKTIINKLLPTDNQYVIQGLTPKQEEFMIESQLERIREERI